MATIEVRPGDIFTEDVEALVNTVNCVGVMGKGLALQFKRRYPQNFAEYAVDCAQGRVRPGRMHVVQLDSQPLQAVAEEPRQAFMFESASPQSPASPVAAPRYIINFPTKDHWRRQSQLAYIRDGLDDLVRVILDEDITSIAVPALGCDLGGLDWLEVEPLITSALAPIDDLDVVILEPRGAMVSTV